MEFFKKDKDKTASSGRIPVPSELSRLTEPERPAPVAEPPPPPRRAIAPPPPPPEIAARIGAELEDAFHEEEPTPPMSKPEPLKMEAPLPSGRATASFRAPPPPPEPVREVVKETVINADAAFKGDFSSEGAMRIDGKVEGKVACKGRLTVGKGATVVGEANVAQAVVEGSVKGNIIAHERVELAPSARVTGDIRAPRLVVGEGAVLQGNVSIGVDASTTTTSTASTSEKSSLEKSDRVERLAAVLSREDKKKGD